MSIWIKDVNLLSMEKDSDLIKDTNIYIEDDKIKYIGDFKAELEADDVIDGREKVALPGLVNAHTHIAMSLLRNYADDLPLHEWLTEKIWPVEAKLTADDVYWGSMLSIVEMIKSGITCFADMYFFMDEVAKAVEESGIRGVLSRGTIEEDDVKASQEKIDDTEIFYKNWNGKANGRIKVLVAPHAPYTCSPGYLKELIDLANKLNTGIHVHLSETKKEVDESIEKYGKSPIKHVYDLGMFELPTLAAHCVHIYADDIQILRDNNVNVANNPTSNLKLASGFAPVEKLLNEGVNVALGTDGSSSNNNLNMFEEIHLASIINKPLNNSAVSIPAETALRMATINGAKAVFWDDEIGSIEVGKKADLILVDLNKPHIYPIHNIVSALAYSAQASDVETVIVDGKIIMKDYQIKTLDEEKIMFEANRAAKELITR